MLIILVLFLISILIVVAFVPYWIRQGRRQATAEASRTRLALELNPLYQQKVAADRAHFLALEKVNQEREAFAHQVHTDMAKLWIDSHVLPAERYLYNAPVESLLALPSLKRAEQPKPEVDTSDDAAAGYPPISLRTVVDELPYNQLAFAFGTVRTTGELLQTTLPYALHTQIAGSSGQGKSVESGGILTQLCASNDADHLWLAALDAEGETTIPFRGLPHVRYQADNPDQAAKTLRNLVKELDYRDTTRKPWPEHAAILVFIEEFLSLKRVMSSHLRNQALEDFTELAIRGRKRWIYLFVVGQTAYTDKETRDAQRQFQSILTFPMPPSAARAAGMAGNNEMLTKLWTQRKQGEGQFLLQGPVSQGDQFVLAPRADERMMKQILGSSQAVPDDFPTTSQVLPDTSPLINGNTGGQQSELDFSILARMRQMLSASNEVPSQNKIIKMCFPDMRASDAQKLYWKYLAALVAEKERGA